LQNRQTPKKRADTLQLEKRIWQLLKNHKKGIEFARRALDIDPDMPGNKGLKALIEKYESSTQQ